MTQNNMEVVATAWKFHGKQFVDLKFSPDPWALERGLLTEIEPLVTLTSSQAEIAIQKQANEVLMRERANIIETKREQLARLTARAEAAEKERDALREALKPFAEAAVDLDDAHRDGSDIWEAPAAISITAGHLRAAISAIQPLEPKND